jgi:hypothetical protein
VKKETDGQIVGAPDQDTGTSPTGEYVPLTAEEELKLQQLLQIFKLSFGVISRRGRKIQGSVT